MIVAVDVDETVAELHGEWLRRYNERSGDNLLPEDLNRWDIQEQLKDGWKTGPKFYDILYEDDLYRHVLPIMGARKAVQRIKESGHRVVYATSCPPGTEQHKLAWLKRYGFLTERDDFVSVKDKSLVNAQVLIDDGPHNIEAFTRASSPTNRRWGFLISQPHNRSFKCGSYQMRVRSIDDAAVSMGRLSIEK